MTFESLLEKFAHPLISPECKIAIVVPVRDEAENIENSLRSLGAQVDLRGKPLDPKIFEIILLANNCTDDSVEVIKTFRCANSSFNIYLAEIVLPRENANVGFVRRLLMNMAHNRLRKNKFGGGVIMTTDGDTIVAKDWIAANLREIEAGADAVGGRIIIPEIELAKMDSHVRAIHLKDESYRLLMAEIEALIDDLPFDNYPRHHQHFNGSFAVTSAIYKKAGGVPEVKFLEDCAFFERLQRIDARVRHSPDVKVYTSSRHIGRSEIGLSFQLNQWKNLSEAKTHFLVESAQSIVERFSAQSDLRKIWSEFSKYKIINSAKIKLISARVFVAPEFITNELKKGQTFGAFCENLLHKQYLIGEWGRKFPPVALDEALRDLEIEVKKRRVQSFSQTSMR